MKRQSGAALISVLLVVAIVTLVCAGMVARQQISIRSQANQMAIRQAWHYALGGEALALGILAADVQKNEKGERPESVDHPQEAWAKPLPIFPIEQGKIAVRIEDLSGRLNVNNLIVDGKIDKESVKRFERLLKLHQIEKPFADRLLDWLDEDHETSGVYGAEDPQYLLMQPAYRAANRKMQDISELRLLLEMTEIEFRRIQPYVSTLPTFVPINVNTASDVVLATLADSLDPEAVQGLISGRGSDGYQDIRSFLDQPGLAGTGVRGIGLAVKSDFFLVQTEVQLSDRKQVLLSTVQRDDDGQLWVLRRSMGRTAPMPSAVLANREEGP